MRSNPKSVNHHVFSYPKIFDFFAERINIFRYHFDIQRKDHIYSFVEQVKLYRLVYNSISI